MLLFYLGLLVAFTTVACELASRRNWIPYWVSRKILHIVAVGACAVAGYTADSLGHRELLIWIVAGAEVLLLALIGFGGLMREESGRKPWGIVWFPLAFLVLLLTTEKADMVGFYMAILAVCDPAATIAGKLISMRPKLKKQGNMKTLDADLVSAGSTQKNLKKWYSFQLTGDPKTLFGSAAFMVSYLLLSLFFPVNDGFFVDYPPLSNGVGSVAVNIPFLYSWPFLFVTGVLITTGEAMGSKGLDNIIVPLMAAYLFNFFGYNYQEFTYTCLLLTPFLVVFCILTVKRKSLSLGGAITASMLGIFIVSGTGPIWLLPLVVFFASSSLIGKLFPAYSSASDAKQKLPRDATQVLANGAIYGILAIIWKHEDTLNLPAAWVQDYPTLLLIAAAVATADTWSSELGQYFRRPTWDLVRWRRVPPGLSGGVSWPGTLAGLAGAGIIAVLGFWLLPNPSLRQILIIIGFGFGGMLIDSVLGSLLQATYRDPVTGALSDVCPENGVLHSGFPWMTNDLVNFLAIALTVGITAGLLWAWN